MSAGVRAAGFAALLVVVFAAALLAGRVLDPGGGGGGGAHPATTGAAAGHGHGAAAPAGLSAVQDGLRLDVIDTTRITGRTDPLAFRILGDAGQTVRGFDIDQGKRMHVIVVRRDLTHYQHLHPIQTADGTWTTELRLAVPGVYRAFADFSTGAQRHTLGVNLLGPGPYAPEHLPAPAPIARIDGYSVTLRERSGGSLSFLVRRGGREIGDVQPYLGARGHLVSLRSGDLAYEHIHPVADGAGSGTIAFAGATTAPGRYRLFLQFRHGDRIHTAAFTREPASP